MSKPVILFVSDVPHFKGGAERSLFDLMANPHIKAELVVPEADLVVGRVGPVQGDIAVLALLQAILGVEEVVVVVLA